MRRQEGSLEFDFRTALSVDQPEVLAQPLKCADFVVEEDDATWMIEVTDALKSSERERITSIASLLGQMKSGNLTKDMLMKQYGTHAYLAQQNFRPGKLVFFCIIIGLPSERSGANAAQRCRMRDEMKRVTNRIGPSFYSTANRPIIMVESIESWNFAQPDASIARVKPLND